MRTIHMCGYRDTCPDGGIPHYCSQEAGHRGEHTPFTCRHEEDSSACECGCKDDPSYSAKNTAEAVTDQNTQQGEPTMDTQNTAVANQLKGCGWKPSPDAPEFLNKSMGLCEVVVYGDYDVDTGEFQVSVEAPVEMALKEAEYLHKALGKIIHEAKNATSETFFEAVKAEVDALDFEHGTMQDLFRAADASQSTNTFMRLAGRRLNQLAKERRRNA